MKYSKFMFAILATILATSCNSNDEDEILATTSETNTTTTDDDGEETATEEEVEAANNSIADYNASDYALSNLTTEATIIITWNGASATVEGNVDSVDVAVDGAVVTVTSTTQKNVEYKLQGTTTDGNIKLYSDHKYLLTLNGVSLASSTTAAINNQGKKSMYVCVAAGTTNTLSDAENYTSADDTEDCKGCLFSEGQIILCGTGTLNVTGNYKHAIATDDFLNINQALTLNIKGSVKDAVHTNDYIVVEAGTTNIINCGADGLQSDEGAIQINGGTFDITTTATASKCIKAVGDIVINGGDFTLTASGNGEWDSTESDYSNAACIKTSGALTITSGTITATATGTASRCIKTSGNVNISGGTLTLNSTGTYMQQSGQDYNTAGALKVSGDMTISNGTIMATSTGTGAKGIKVSGTYTQTGGDVTASASGTSLGSSSNNMGWGSSASSYTSRAKG